MEIINEINRKELEQFIGMTIEKYIDIFLNKNYETIINTFYGFGNQFDYSPELNVELKFRIDHSKFTFIKLDSLADHVWNNIFNEIKKHGFEFEIHHYNYYKKFRKFKIFKKRYEALGHCIRIVKKGGKK